MKCGALPYFSKARDSSVDRLKTKQNSEVSGFFVFIFEALLAPQSRMDKLKWFLPNLLREV